MPERQIQSSSVATLDLHGVNERVAPTYLPPEEFSQVAGVFPEFAGMQTRIFGKRVLAKYANPIYGIHQFFGPQGYGAGLYQFDGTVGTAPWITPVSKITLALLPLAVDGGNVTLDEFGKPWGGGGIVAPNLCVPNFNGLNAAGVQCLPQVTNFNAPIDDNNGSGAGKGRRCVWQAISTQADLSFNNPAEYTGTNRFGSYANVPVSDIFVNPPQGTVPYPPFDPNFPALCPITEGIPTLTTGTGYNSGLPSGYYYDINGVWGSPIPNPYTSSYQFKNTAAYRLNTGVFNLTSLYADPAVVSVTIALQVTVFPNASYYINVDTGTYRGNPDANPPIADNFSYIFDLTSYAQNAIALSSDGYHFSRNFTKVIVDPFIDGYALARFYTVKRVKVCTNN